MTVLLPALVALLVWWASTGAVLVAVRQAEAAPRAVLGGVALLFAGSLAALVASADDMTAFGAYLAFAGAIGLWGVQELAFLAGWITGPWRSPPPPGLGEWRRAGYAIAAIIYHELALAASGILAVAATWNGGNQVGAWTFGALFALRISAKLNVFLGVSNLAEGFLPKHLDYLKGFFGEKPINLLFPVSVGLSTLALAEIVGRAAELDGPARTGPVLLGTLVALGILEHWLLVLPVPVERLWAWSLQAEAAPAGSPIAEFEHRNVAAARAGAAEPRGGRVAP